MSCFITHYASPLGRLLLAADEEGLTGLWLEGQKYFAAGLPQQREEQRTPALEEASRILLRRCILWARIFSGRCGSFCCRSPMGRPPPMARWPGNWRGSAA